MKYLVDSLKGLISHRIYIFYSLAYGISTLIVPFGIQFLVNKLAISGLWANIIVFIALIVLALLVSHAIKYSQLIILESLQREIFCIEIDKWRKLKDTKKSFYYFEIFNLVKTFSNSYSNVIEMLLVTSFGLLTIILFHPFFFVLVLIILLIIFLIYKSSINEIIFASKESDQKYELHTKLANGESIDESNILKYLEVREEHFSYVRSNTFKLSSLAIIIQSVFLILGCYLITINQLSIGQLVSAEIILTGILNSLSKLPKTIEAANFYGVSRIKIDKALGLNYE